MKPIPSAKDIMDRRPGRLVRGTRLREAARVLARKKTGSLPVVDAEGTLLGFFSLQSLMMALTDAVQHLAPPGPVESYLDPRPPVLAEQASLLQIAQAFADEGLECTTLPVLRAGRLVGTVTRNDVVLAIYDYFKDVQDEGARTLYLSALRGEPPF